MLSMHTVSGAPLQFSTTPKRRERLPRAAYREYHASRPSLGRELLPLFDRVWQECYSTNGRASLLERFEEKYAENKGEWDQILYEHAEKGARRTQREINREFRTCYEASERKALEAKRAGKGEDDSFDFGALELPASLTGVESKSGRPEIYVTAMHAVLRQAGFFRASNCARVIVEAGRWVSEIRLMFSSSRRARAKVAKEYGFVISANDNGWRVVS
ncbi:MAG: hypothetical protein ACHREM_01015 [Polyangiales bacterium]